LRDENSSLKRKDLKLVQVRDAETAVLNQPFKVLLQLLWELKALFLRLLSRKLPRFFLKLLSEVSVMNFGLERKRNCRTFDPCRYRSKKIAEMIVGSQEEYDKLSENMERSFKRSERTLSLNNHYLYQYQKACIHTGLF
jgi:DNA-directed RNA polymerase subunit beta'